MMVKILREIKGGYRHREPKTIFVIDKPAGLFSPATKKLVTDPENSNPYYEVWCSVKGKNWVWELSEDNFVSLTNGKFALVFTNDHTGEIELYIYMYDGKLYQSEIELSIEEFLTVFQKEVLAKKEKLQAALDKIKAETEAEGYSREPISDEIQVFVWNRDGGKCIKCGSNENLEYDHIIPVSKGGSNTARNIQLMCQSCNRSKSNKIGG